MFFDACDYGIDVSLCVVEDKRVVDINDYVCCFCWCDAVEEAVVEG